MSNRVGRKVVLHLGVSQTVAQRIEHYAYKAGVMEHTLVENALEFAITHKLDVRQYTNDPLIQLFLRTPKGDAWASVDVRVSPAFAVKVERLAKKQKLLRREYIALAIAYYVAYVMRLIKPRGRWKSTLQSQSSQTLPQQ